MTKPMMMRPGTRIALALAGLLIVAGSAPEARAEQWLTYANDRFGATADYPARFSLRHEPPANGDGQRFRTADQRAEVAVFGFFNVENQTPKQIMQSRKDAGTTYALATANSSVFALSGWRGDRIVYERCLRSRYDRSIFVCVNLEYPAAEQAAWNVIVERVAKSLRAGKPW